jgi:multicomponent Na+:H+ antiporter subunit G
VTQQIAEVIAAIAVIAGTGFSVIGVLGYVRLPDVYTRLHAVSKVSVFGVVLLLFGALLWSPVGVGKSLVLIAMLVIAAPSISHALGSAAYRIGIEPVIAERDDLDDSIAVEPGTADSSVGTEPAAGERDDIADGNDIDQAAGAPGSSG